ncbi:adenosylcobinamide-GDP ribazoletransferase [Roseicitreum antarcticum]|uniref:Adenosylcobinamide-GDP ribazoletransferase n=1 Tax=Roseicitreum antarcticum TaxID=564137 RepID=A0A1H3CAF5_9RHOB|nr:adenosylcobinamide-GDP ribazoletransferase [Roseicitreum antarcticum]SDX51162.1 cobalamin-5'-phosphate synthase [Roseicitreum antarcticum]
MTGLRDHLAALILAVQFLTRLPLPFDVFSAPRMALAPQWFGAVGLLTGGLMAGCVLLFAQVLPMSLAVLLSVTLGIWLTGALHEDGFADTCDGLGGGGTAARALEIMRDSRIGAYGALGLMLLLALKVLALVQLGASGALAVAVALVAGQSVSRVMMTVALRSGAYLRSGGGAGAAMVQPFAPMGWLVLGLSGGLGAGLAATVLPLGAVALGGVASALGLFTLRRIYLRRLGGHTGDLLGAVQQVSEVAFYLGVLIWL